MLSSGVALFLTLGFYPAILHAKKAVSIGRQFLIMCDHEDGLAQPLIQVS
jgi:hypothetical protein